LHLLFQILDSHSESCKEEIIELIEGGYIKSEAIEKLWAVFDDDLKNAAFKSPYAIRFLPAIWDTVNDISKEPASEYLVQVYQYSKVALEKLRTACLEYSKYYEDKFVEFWGGCLSSEDQEELKKIGDFAAIINETNLKVKNCIDEFLGVSGSNGSDF
jgi:hypothetical protein